MTPYYADDWLTVYQGDCRSVMAEMEPESVHCVVTSPPYWGLRDYGTASWVGGDEACGHSVGGQVAQTKHPAEGHASGQRPGVDASVCRKCGAIREDGQLGLEPTPEQYVEDMVAVFREVKRVLRSDGTVWLNLGDSYNSGGAGNTKSRSEQGNGSGRFDVHGGAGAEEHHAAGRRARGLRPQYGVKPKDLVGIPWRVAFALQQPYYTGTIRDQSDRSWLAAMLDAEGCLFIHKRKTGQHNGQGYYRTHDSYGPGVEIANTSRAVVDRIMSLVGKGSISTQLAGTHGRKQTIYRWNLRTIECRDFVRELYPHLVAKQQQARILIGCPSSGERAEAAHGALMALHRTGSSDVDFPAPASMYEPGWYVRSDIIWNKANPMPESVTDRPTKAHEYLFLLSKSPTYYFDQEAVREQSQPGGSEAIRRVREGARDATPTTGNAGGSSEGTSAGAPVLLHGQGQGSTEAVPLERQGQGQLGAWGPQASWSDGDRQHVDGGSMGGDSGRPASSVSVLRQGDDSDNGPHHPVIEGRAPHPGERGGSVSELQQREGQSLGRNLRSVWTIATQPYPGAHFATFPPKLVEPCIKAGTSERGVCPECGAPWVREVERQNESTYKRIMRETGTTYHDMKAEAAANGITPGNVGGTHRPGRRGETLAPTQNLTTGWSPSCAHVSPLPPAGAVILDPFAGSGTTGMVAQSLSRRAVLIDLSLDYLGQLMDRNRDIPLGLGA